MFNITTLLKVFQMRIFIEIYERTKIFTILYDITRKVYKAIGDEYSEILTVLNKSTYSLKINPLFRYEIKHEI